MPPLETMRFGVIDVTSLYLSATLVGMVLGIRFRFVVLFPAIAAGCLIAALIDIGAGESVSDAALSMIATACLLQLGYVCTSLIAAPFFRDEERSEEHEAKAARINGSANPHRSTSRSAS